jgi:hypothetical protein
MAARAPAIIANTLRLLAEDLALCFRTPPNVRPFLRRLALTLAKVAIVAVCLVKAPLPVRTGRLLTRWRMKTGRTRTLWGVTPILTLPLLARCDRLLGLGSSSLVYTTYHVSRHFDVDLSRISGWLERTCPAVHYRFSRWVFAWTLLRYDIFHLFNDRGVMSPTVRMGVNPIELAALKRAGKRLYTYAYGADVRTRARTLAMGEYNLCAACPQPGVYCQCDDEVGEENMRMIGRHANAMVATGDMLAYVPGARNMPYWPIDVHRRSLTTRPRRPGPFRVAHAPNHEAFKGTAHLERAVTKLRAQNHEIELVRVQGVPNAKVLELFEDADVVADQFIAGFHGYTALEAMALGKPVLCYLRGPDMAVDFERCPIIRADPDSLESVLRDCVTGKVDLEGIGADSRRYVETYYSPEAIASQVGRMYLDTAELSGMTLQRVSEVLAGKRAMTGRVLA